VGDEVRAVKPGDFVRGDARHCGMPPVPAGAGHICKNLRIIGIDQDGGVRRIRENSGIDILGSGCGDSEHYGAIPIRWGMRCNTVLAGPIRGRRFWLRGAGRLG